MYSYLLRCLASIEPQGFSYLVVVLVEYKGPTVKF